MDCVIAAQNGMSLIQIINDAGFDELLTLRGVCLSCATRHVYGDHPPF